MILLSLSKNIHVHRVGLKLDIRKWAIDVYDINEVTSYGSLNFIIYRGLFWVGVTAWIWWFYCLLFATLTEFVWFSPLFSFAWIPYKFHLSWLTMSNALVRSVNNPLLWGYCYGHVRFSEKIIKGFVDWPFLNPNFWVKGLRCGINHPSSSSTEFKERVEL
jgi:hypothetical protein